MSPSREGPEAAAVPGTGRIPCDLVIRNASSLCLVPPGKQAAAGVPDLGVISRGALAARRGQVVWAGPDSEASAVLVPEAGCESIDASGCTVTPGLIDAHAHLPFHGSRAGEFSLRLKGVSYLEILKAGGGIMSTVRATSQASDEVLLEGGLSTLDRMLRSGVTTVETKSGYGLSADGELRLLRLMRKMGEVSPVETVSTFLGAHAVPPEYKGKPELYVEVVLEEMLPAVKQLGLAEFCDIFCEPGVFDIDQSRQVLMRAKELGLAAKIHADEMSWSGGAELAAEVGAVSADHLLFASERGLRAMGEAGTTAVLLPVTVLSLLGDAVDVRHCRDQARLVRQAGVKVAVGTDYNPGTAPSSSVQLAMSLACRIFGLSVEEALAAATHGAACALGRGDRLGSLLPGYQADAAGFEATGYEDIPYRLDGVQVRFVVKRGKVVFRSR